MNEAREDILICRCQEVTESEILAAIQDGAVTVDGGKDYLRRCGNREDYEDLRGDEEMICTPATKRL